jgi:hypothetical protein
MWVPQWAALRPLLKDNLRPLFILTTMSDPMLSTLNIDTLIKEYVSKKDDLCLFTKTYEENKTSLEVLLRNVEPVNDSMLVAAVDALSVHVDKQEAVYHQKAQEVSELAAKIKEQKALCIQLMNALLLTTQKISQLDDIGLTDEEKDADNVVLAKCANTLYQKKVDNRDLRSAPPICGTVKKDELRTDLEFDKKGDVAAYDGDEYAPGVTPSPMTKKWGDSNLKWV